jgi:hypothetical protein
MGANESYQLTIEPPTEYCSDDGSSCSALPGPGRTLKQTYQDKHQEEVETRLEQAGVRLAAIIQKNLPVE